MTNAQCLEVARKYRYDYPDILCYIKADGTWDIEYGQKKELW